MEARILTNKESMSINADVIYDPIQEALELREQLASDKRRLAFLFGAGTSIAVGLPSLETLTSEIDKSITGNLKRALDIIKKELPPSHNIEDILNRVRLYRELTSDGQVKIFGDKSDSPTIIGLELAICEKICELVSRKPPGGITPHWILAQWIQHIDREYPVEVFTTNYDHLFEIAMEQAGVPFFDGFIGAVEPFFAPESVEADGGKVLGRVYPPRGWARLWKLHGSIGWRLRIHPITRRSNVFRVSGNACPQGVEFLIYPSREKYLESRKLPFLAFQDRLRKFLTIGEGLLITCGYSFRDQHLNEIIFQGLRGNNRGNWGQVLQ
jgi:hypothetical protein